MAVAIGDHVRITAKMKLFGTDDVMNVYTFEVDRNDTVDDAGFMVALALHMDDAYTLINGDLSDDLTYESVDGQNITQDVLLPETAWPVLVTGNLAAIILPTQVAGCVFWPTTTPKVRTSSFLGGYTVSALAAGGVLGAAVITRLVSFGVAMRDVATANVDATKGSLNPISSIFTPSGVGQVPNRWRTQRRRRIGVGS